jgi:hypothetical protein
MWCKHGCYIRGFHHEQATSMPKLVAVSAIFIYSFQKSLLEHTLCFVCLWMCMAVLTCIHQLHWLCCFLTFWPTCTHFTAANSSVQNGSQLLTVSPPLSFFQTPNSSEHKWQPNVNGTQPLSLLQTTKNTQFHFACPWCKSAVGKSLSCHANLVQMDYNWTTLTACHNLTSSNSMTRPQQCCQLCNNTFHYCPYFLTTSCIRN